MIESNHDTTINSLESIRSFLSIYLFGHNATFWFYKMWMAFGPTAGERKQITLRNVSDVCFCLVVFSLLCLLCGLEFCCECFHEISYSHLSFKALEHYSTIHNMKLEQIPGGHAFGIDYHLQVLFYPIPFKYARKIKTS